MPARRASPAANGSPTGTHTPPAHSTDQNATTEAADRSMDAAACIGCGACVAACPNGSAMLFTSAKLAHLNLLPQGQPERKDRAMLMVEQMDKEGFGGCTNIGECEAVCPKEISLDFIAMMNRDLISATFSGAGKR